MIEITCTKCNENKNEEEFPLNGNGHGGRRKQCKKCMNEINKQWRRTNAEKVIKYNREKRKKQVGQV